MSVTVDLTQFNQAMREYAVAGQKTMAEANNKKTVDLLLWAAKFSKVGSKGTIAAFMSQDSLPKLVAYWLGGGYTRQQARSFAARMKRRRVASVNFLKAYFVAAADGFRGIPTRTGHKVTAKRATTSDPKTAITSEHSYKALKSRRWTTPQQTAARAEAMLLATINRAIAYQIADMNVYIARKLGETARKFSWTGIGNSIKAG
jgi:hypothetical protein